MIMDKTAREDAIMSVFEEKEIQLITPTNIQIPLSFSIGDIAFYSKADLESTTELITKFIDEAGAKRILMWEVEDTINFGYLKVVDNVTELHYIAIEVGK